MASKIRKRTSSKSKPMSGATSQSQEYEDEADLASRGDHYRQRDKEGRFEDFDRQQDRSSSRYSNQSKRYEDERSQPREDLH